MLTGRRLPALTQMLDELRILFRRELLVLLVEAPWMRAAITLSTLVDGLQIVGRLSHHSNRQSTAKNCDTWRRRMLGKMACGDNE